MTCSGCDRIHPSVQESLEFGAVICDGCYGLRLAAEAKRREQWVSANTRAHFEAIRSAREINQLGV